MLLDRTFPEFSAEKKTEIIIGGIPNEQIVRTSGRQELKIFNLSTDTCKEWALCRSIVKRRGKEGIKRELRERRQRRPKATASNRVQKRNRIQIRIEKRENVITVKELDI